MEGPVRADPPHDSSKRLSGLGKDTLFLKLLKLLPGHP